MQNENSLKNSHGGRREGAGRKKTMEGARTFGIRVPGDIAEILSRQANKSAYVAEAIRAFEAARHQ